MLKGSGTPFFPDYTDHGPDHVQDVLVTAQGLIRDEAYPHLTPADVATLALSVLLHDVAMHLSEDGFVRLVKGEFCVHPDATFNDLRWEDLWTDFLGEASRFDGRRLVALFGDTDPVHRPPLDPTLMTKRDRLLIGEFLRRHHHRLAHEIARHGVPGVAEDLLRLVHIPEHLSDISGYVARSHGCPLRSSVDYLKRRYNEREYQGIHGTFLMVLLRVADYVQLQSQRAPQGLLQVKSLRSPISQREWRAHAAIKDIRHTHEDPEAIFVEAQPRDIDTYLRIKDWLDGIQQEIDASWSALGEVYGRYSGLYSFGLVLRRVRSNLDDTAQFAKTVTFVPKKASFEAANPDLLKHLVAPLYGDAPEIGLRELIQNAVDAVRERKQLEKDSPDPSAAVESVDTHNGGDSDVTIIFQQQMGGGWQVSVCDRGMGMTLSTVLDYFLKAGASYRQSDSWRQDFEDEAGQSRVLRSGRFGVGVLAAFLLAQRIEVTTLHVRDEHGFRFATDLDVEQIEIRHVNADIGTTIRVDVKGPRARTLDGWFDITHWEFRGARDGYCLRQPSVRREVRFLEDSKFFLKDDIEIFSEFNLPHLGVHLPPDWRAIHSAGYREIHWTYSHAPALACNGIEVVKDDDDFKWASSQKDIFELPRLSVFDPDGRLPLNLQRNDVVQSECPFGDALLKDVCCDFLSFLLVHGPKSYAANVFTADALQRRCYEGLKTDSVGPIFLANDGFGFLIRSESERCRH